jgi:hypothetical protein
MSRTGEGAARSPAPPAGSNGVAPRREAPVAEGCGAVASGAGPVGSLRTEVAPTVARDADAEAGDAELAVEAPELRLARTVGSSTGAGPAVGCGDRVRVGAV